MLVISAFTRWSKICQNRYSAGVRHPLLSMEVKMPYRNSFCLSRVVDLPTYGELAAVSATAGKNETTAEVMGDNKSVTTLTDTSP